MNQGAHDFSHADGVICGDCEDGTCDRCHDAGFCGTCGAARWMAERVSCTSEQRCTPNNVTVANALWREADELEIANRRDDHFRVTALRLGARIVAAQTVELSELGRLPKIKGVGRGIRARVERMLREGVAVVETESVIPAAMALCASDERVLH